MLICEFCCFSISTVKHLWAYFEWVLFVLCRWAMLLLATHVCVNVICDCLRFAIYLDLEFIFLFVCFIVLPHSYSGLCKLFVVVTNYFSIRKINRLIGLAPFLSRFIFQCFTRSRQDNVPRSNFVVAIHFGWAFPVTYWGKFIKFTWALLSSVFIVQLFLCRKSVVRCAWACYNESTVGSTTVCRCIWLCTSQEEVSGRMS